MGILENHSESLSPQEKRDRKKRQRLKLILKNANSFTKKHLLTLKWLHRKSHSPRQRTGLLKSTVVYVLVRLQYIQHQYGLRLQDYHPYHTNIQTKPPTFLDTKYLYTRAFWILTHSVTLVLVHNKIILSLYKSHVVFVR